MKRYEMNWFVGLSLTVLLCLGAVGDAFGYERAPAEVVKALGTKRGRPVSSGLVFIDGKYIKAPYRVTRAGNQILINERPVTGQLIAWEEFLKTQPASRVTVTEIEESVAAPSTGPADATSDEDGVDPAAPKDGGNAAPPAAADGSAAVRVVIEDTRCAAGADELEDFKPDAPEQMKLTDIPPDSKEDKERQKRAEEEDEDDETDVTPVSTSAPVAPAAASDDPVDPASPEGEAAAKAAAAAAPKPAVKTRKVYSLEGAFDMNFRAQKLMKPIDAYRTRIEATLRRGGYIFFGTSAARYCTGLRTSDASASKELLKKLPELMREANGSEGFCDAVRTSGLMSYISYQIAQDLYRNKTDFAALMQRRRELAEDEKLKKLMNR